MQDLKMHVRNLQEQAIEYMHDRYLSSMMFLHSLKDDALKWYFQLLKSNIHRYEDLIHSFLYKFSCNIPK